MMFDRQFFGTILPEHVQATARNHPGKVPVIELHLGDRTVLDLCHIVRLADTWVAVAHFCADDSFEDYDVAFVPYPTIVRVALTMKRNDERQIGFSADAVPDELPAEGSLPVIVTPSQGAATDRVG
jgi:hypothetical protein